MEINKQLIPQSAAKRPMIRQSPKWLTIHSTGNPKSTAQNERDFLASPSNKRQASYHVVVDSKQAIMCVPYSEVAYHAGDGQGDGNRASIGLEICESGSRKKVLQNAAEVAAKILIDYGWGIDRMTTHNHWSGKNCPRILRDKAYVVGGMDWEYFKGLVAKEMDKMVIKQVKIKLNGKVKTVEAIEQDGYNYIKLQDLRDSKIEIGYDGIPIINAK